MVDAVSFLSNMVRRHSVRGRFIHDGDTWPPDQPKNFTPLVLIHYKGQQNYKQAMAMTKLTQTGDIDSLANNQSLSEHHPSYEPVQEVLNASTITKEFEQILAPLEKNDEPPFILIKGPPGVGKSVLLKEIAYRWGEQHILTRFKLVLLVHLRDPIVQQSTSVHDLLQLFCRGHKRAAEIADLCNEYLFFTGGEDLLFLFDGFDEFPEIFKKPGSLIFDILHREILPSCGLILSSRPHASANIFSKVVTLKVDVLGFTETERVKFIKQALKDEPSKIPLLTKYLEDHLTISGICFIPFNMVILLYLCKQGISFPNNPTQLYNYFICLTLCRHLAKSGISLENNITDLNSLPEPCGTIVQQLSKLSFEFLNDNKLIFTFDEVKSVCPDIESVPGAITGFGLLQTVHHYGLTGKMMTFNFVHFSIQEFLAAYHVATLPSEKELQVLDKKFWSSIHSNMFSIYISLTKGQRSAFKKFLSGGSDTVAISPKFLQDCLKCVRLFRCFYDVDDVKIYRSIQNAKMFHNKEVVFPYSGRPSPYDIECATLFLTCAVHKQWNVVKMSGCQIQDHGFRVLHRGIIGTGISIKHLWLTDCGLTQSSASSVSDTTIQCRVEVLGVNGNRTIGEDYSLYEILSNPSSKLVELNLMNTGLTSDAAIALFHALTNSNLLLNLVISFNAITDEACDVIATSIKVNTSLVHLEMHRNKIGQKAALHVVQALGCDSSLVHLYLDSYSNQFEREIECIQTKLNEEREACGCQAKVDIWCL